MQPTPYHSKLLPPVLAPKAFLPFQSIQLGMFMNKLRNQLSLSNLNISQFQAPPQQQPIMFQANEFILKKLKTNLTDGSDQNCPLTRVLQYPQDDLTHDQKIAAILKFKEELKLHDDINSLSRLQLACNSQIACPQGSLIGPPMVFQTTRILTQPNQQLCAESQISMKTSTNIEHEVVVKIATINPMEESQDQQSLPKKAKKKVRRESFEENEKETDCEQEDEPEIDNKGDKNYVPKLSRASRLKTLEIVRKQPERKKTEEERPKQENELQGIMTLAPDLKNLLGFENLDYEKLFALWQRSDKDEHKFFVKLRRNLSYYKKTLRTDTQFEN